MPPRRRVAARLDLLVKELEKIAEALERRDPRPPASAKRAERSHLRLEGRPHS